MGKLDGKEAVMSDARLGIGLAPAKPFVAEGAVVSITAHWQEVF